MSRAFAIFLLISLPIIGHAAVEERPGGWVLSNDLLSVSLDAATGALTVIDKASGATFRQPDSLRDPLDSDDPLVILPADGVALDGQVSDWANTPVQVIDSSTLTSEKPWECDGDEDLSAVVGFRWDQEYVYALFLVRDDEFVPGNRDMREWWERDSVEWRVGWDQTGVMLDAADPGGFLWGEWQDWSPAAVREVADFGDDASALAIASSAGLDWRGARGYIVESATEIGRFIVVNRNPIPGRRFRISAGVNDADATGEREAQSYWPATFVMGQSMTYTVGVLADANGNTPDVVDDRDPAATDARALGDDGLSFVVAADRPEATIGHIRCDLQLPEGERDLRVTCSVVDGWDWGLPLFRGFLPEPESAEYVASIYGNGVLIPTTDLAPPSTWLRPFHQLDMPAIGVVSSAGDALCIFDDHDYSSGSLSPAMWDGEKRLGLILQGDNMKGERLPEYRFTWHFAGSGGYVGLAKRVREYCAAKGWVKTLREKREANPSIDLLLGAPDVWGDSSLEFAREAKAAGIDRLLINGGMTPEVIREINALGYLTGEYDQYVDVDETTDHIGDIDPLVDHIRIQADGERAKGWANLDGSHQWYSRCSETALMGAQHEIPSRLATHAFTARFLDVHTAMGLVECYSEDHPCDCTTDRENKIEMLQWIREQSVVVGGEHGRAWSAAVLDYQEGMMSHNPFFTWPAGHLVKVDSEEQIGERYLEWGINHERRVPFWELVFHDCVVSTWYWGDSVGYLDDVRPDLTDRKVAMTALYGTAPLFWATKLGLNFDEEGKPKFLEAYRNCCKIHEAVGYEEMLSHEYLSDDRSVQRTTFSDGTTVTVNFGEEPATVKSGGKRWTLPMNGIVADGPTIHQHIAIIDGTVETYIERPGYRFLEREEGIANHAGLKCEGPLTAQLVEPGRIRLHAQPTTLSASADMRSIDPDFRADTARVLFAGDDLTSRQEQFGRLREGRVRCSPIDGEWTVFDVVYGEATRASDLWVHFDPPMGHGPQVTQGDAFHQRVRVANVGQDGGRAMLRAYWDTQTPDRLIFSEQVEVDGGATKEVQVRADTSQVAGTRLLIVAAEVDGPEMVTSDNVVTHPVFVTPDFDRWPIRAQVQVGLGGIARPYPKVEARLDFTSFLDGAELDPSSVHVATIGEDGKPADLLFAQFEPDADFDGRANAAGTLVIQTDQEFDGADDPQYVVLLAPVAQPGFLPMRYLNAPNSAAGEVSKWAYKANVADGAIRSLRYTGKPGAATDLIRQVIFSSQETGWSEPEGTVDEFEVLADGPVRTIVRTVKTLRGGNVVTRTYDFRGDHFFVDVSADELQQGLFSRIWYDREGTYEDSAGNKARIDGDGENEIESALDPTWYCMYSDEASHACIALSPMAGIVYWDQGEAYGQLGFQTASPTGFRCAHVISGPQENADFAREWYERLTNPPTLTLRAD